MAGQPPRALAQHPVERREVRLTVLRPSGPSPGMRTATAMMSLPTADTAFDLLKWRSQETNVKLRTLAEQLLADFVTLRDDDTVPSQATFDQLLLTAHERITGARAATD